MNAQSMKRFAWLLVAVMMTLPSLRASAQYFDHLALGATVGVDGFGLELAAPLGNQIQVRAGYSMLPPMWKPHRVFTLEETADHTDTDVDIEAVSKLGGANLMIDWHPGGNKVFFFTAGMIAGSPTILKARNRAPFLDEEEWGKEGLVFGDVMVTTDNKGIAEARLNVWPVRPYVGLGLGNAVNASKRVCFNFELGTCFTGGYKVNVTGENLETFEKGNVNVTSAQVNNEDDGIIDKMGKFPILPVLKFGLYVKLF